MTDTDAQLTGAAAGGLRQPVQFQSRIGLRYFLKRFAGESPLNVIALAIIILFLLL